MMHALYVVSFLSAHTSSICDIETVGLLVNLHLLIIIDVYDIGCKQIHGPAICYSNIIVIILNATLSRNKSVQGNTSLQNLTSY